MGESLVEPVQYRWFSKHLATRALKTALYKEDLVIDYFSQPEAE